MLQCVLKCECMMYLVNRQLPEVIWEINLETVVTQCVVDLSNISHQLFVLHINWKRTAGTGQIILSNEINHKRLKLYPKYRLARTFICSLNL